VAKQQVPPLRSHSLASVGMTSVVAKGSFGPPV
jgi:hypothetical protein